MASAKSSKTITIKELPEQIIRYEIFTKVPIKSVAQCKSVCKSWLSLLSDSKLAIEQCDVRAMQNPNDYDYLVAYKFSTGLVSLSRDKETRLLPPDRYNMAKLIGSIHGLVCLRYDDKLWLWNPAIHQCKEFESPHLQRHGRRMYCWDNFGFGFDHTSNDYKVVALNNSADNMWSAFLYSSNSDTWSYLIVPDYVLHTESDERISYRPATIVKDCPYWTSYRRHQSDKFVALIALKLETRSNKFKLLPEFHCKSGENTKLVNMMDRATVMDHEQDSGNISVHVYSLDKEESDGWSKMYSVGPIANCGIKRNLTQGFKYGGAIDFCEDGVFSYYDHKTDIISLISGKMSFDVASCYSYTPSLVFVKGMKLGTPLVSIKQFTKT